MVASMRAGYRLLENGEAEEVRTVFLCFKALYPPSRLGLGLPLANEALGDWKNPEQCPALSPNHHRPSRMG